jgi:hypothetical protein
MTRVSVSVKDELKVGIEETPDEFDLDPSLSQAGRYALLLEEGARLRRARHRERLRYAAYLAFAAEPTHEEATGELFELAVKDGLI